MEHTTFTNRTLRFDELPQWEYVEKNRISPKYKYIVIIKHLEEADTAYLGALLFL